MISGVAQRKLKRMQISFRKVLPKEFSEAMEKIEEYGKAKDVPDDKRYLVEDFREKSDRLAKYFIECEKLNEEFNDFWDYMMGEKLDSIIIS